MKKICFFTTEAPPTSFVNAINDLPEEFRKVIRITGGCDAIFLTLL
jgi:hypothetical protein